MEDFEMGPAEAVEDAIKQFKSQVRVKIGHGPAQF